MSESSSAKIIEAIGKVVEAQNRMAEAQRTTNALLAALLDALADDGDHEDSDPTHYLDGSPI